MGSGLEHWSIEWLLIFAFVSAACGVLLSCFFLLPAFVLAACCPVPFFFLSFFAFTHCWLGDVVAASIRFARPHKLVDSCPVL